MVMLLELKNRPNNLSNIYLLINDLLHPRNLVFNADVKVLRRNSPIYQKFFCILVYILYNITLSPFFITFHKKCACQKSLPTPKFAL